MKLFRRNLIQTRTDCFLHVLSNCLPRKVYLTTATIFFLFLIASSWPEEACLLLFWAVKGGLHDPPFCVFFSFGPTGQNDVAEAPSVLTSVPRPTAPVLLMQLVFSVFHGRGSCIVPWFFLFLFSFASVHLTSLPLSPPSIDRRVISRMSVE